MITNQNPKPKCPPNTCLVCDTPKGGYCRAKGICYEIKCKECKAAYYDGQTGRNGKVRGKEHLDKAKSKDPKVLEKSFIHRHQVEDHEGATVGWEMKVLGRFPKDPLKRLVTESKNISNRAKEESLNSKLEMAKSNLVTISFISDQKKALNDKKQIAEALQKERSTAYPHKPPPNNPKENPVPEKSNVQTIIQSIESKTQTPIKLPKTPSNKASKKNISESIKRYISHTPRTPHGHTPMWQKTPNKNSTHKTAPTANTPSNTSQQ